MQPQVDSTRSSLPPALGAEASTSVPSAPESATHELVVGATDAHLDDEAHVLPIGSDVHPAAQARHLEEAPTKVVATEVEKVKAADRALRGEVQKGTVVYGLEDDRLWAMLRRFNIQINHTLSPPTKLPAGQPDLRPSTLPAVPFNSDILKSNAERVYATAGVSGIYFTREMARLMSWRPEERNRTLAFCISYFISCFLSMTVPFIMGILIVLTVYPPSRIFLFPPIKPLPGKPVSATDPTNRKGDESVLTGVGKPIVHRSKAEQIEEQAWEFTNIVQRFGFRVFMGGHTKAHQGNGQVGRKEAESSSEDLDTEEEEDVELVEMDKKENATKDLTEKQKKKLKAKEAKQKRDQMVGEMAKSAQDGLGDFADALERVHNALSPPRVYPRTLGREKLAGAIFLPILLVTAVVPAHVWAQSGSFLFGIAFFGQPLLIRAAKKFVHLVPDWQERIDLRNSIFSGVPTDAQIILHLLREAESQYDPLPPPPPPPTSDAMKKEIAKSGITAEAGTNEQAIPQAEPDQPEGHTDEEGEPSVAKKVGAKGARKLLGGLRLAAKKAATFRADVTVDGGRAKVGNKIDRIFYQSRAKDLGTLDSFPAKLDGTSGHLIVKHEPGTVSTLDFVPLRNPEHPTFSAPIGDLVEIKKRGIFVGRAVLGWAAAISLEGMGLELRFKDHVQRVTDGIGHGDDPHEETHEGDLWEFSHVGRRDQLFARLVCVGGQKWETL